LNGLAAVSILSVMPTAATAQKFKSGKIQYQVTGDNTVAIYKYDDKNVTALEIPATVENRRKVYKVTEISESVFSGHLNLTSVVFPDDLTTIGKSAFEECSKLTSTVFPESLKTIGSRAFAGCSNLTSVVFPEGLETIGSSAFSGCSNLTSIVFPENLKTVSESVLSGCTNLTSVVFPENLKTIGSYAFSGCGNLTSISFPEGLETIDISAFYGCNKLVIESLPDSLTSVNSFRDCIISENAKQQIENIKQAKKRAALNAKMAEYKPLETLVTVKDGETFYKGGMASEMIDSLEIGFVLTAAKDSVVNFVIRMTNLRGNSSTISGHSTYSARCSINKVSFFNNSIKDLKFGKDGATGKTVLYYDYTDYSTTGHPTKNILICDEIINFMPVNTQTVLRKMH